MVSKKDRDMSEIGDQQQHFWFHQQDHLEITLSNNLLVLNLNVTAINYLNFTSNAPQLDIKDH